MATKKQLSTQEGREFFRRLVQEGPWAPVYLLMGSERFLIQEAVDRLVRSVFPDGPDDFNDARFDAHEDSAADVVAACETLPMFADRRVVRVRNVSMWKAHDLNALAAYIERPAETTLLILDADNIPRKSGAARTILDSKNVASIRLDAMDTAETVQWAGRRAKRYHIKLQRHTAALLVDHVGDSLEALDRALEKLMLFSGANAENPVLITEEILDEVVVDARMRSVFELTDALGSRDLARSIRTYRRMRLHGDSPIGAVSMIAREFRGMLTSQLGAQRRASDAEIAKLVGSPPWAVKKYAQRARAFTLDELRSIVMHTTQVATELTSSRLDDDLHVERLILEICTPRARTKRTPRR